MTASPLYTLLSIKEKAQAAKKGKSIAMKLHNVPTCNQKLKVALCSAAICIFILVIAAPAYALQCGDTITTDAKLTADLGPCPGNGLVIFHSHPTDQTTLTLDLNGHSIKGMGSGIGLGILGCYDVDLTVKGPGSIEDFDMGIKLLDVGQSIIIRGLTLRANNTGMVANSAMEGLRVLRNTIDGADKPGSVGIAIGPSVVEAYFYRNIITRNSKGISVWGSVTNFNQNLIAFNGTGFFSSDFEYNCFTLRGNRIASNKGNGIDLVNVPKPESAQMQVITAGGQCHVIEDNEVEHNGGSGIVLTDGRQFLLQDNVVQHNRANGIGITAAGTESDGNNLIIGNEVLHNGTDLFWDQVPTYDTNCWNQNIARTSSPPALPECQ